MMKKVILTLAAATGLLCGANENALILNQWDSAGTNVIAPYYVADPGAAVDYYLSWNDTTNLAEWGEVISTPEGTAILSTGETGGVKFLREDGDGTCSWQGAGNPFDQDLDTTDSPTFAALTANGRIGATHLDLTNGAGPGTASLTADGAGVLALTDDTNAQELRVYSDLGDYSGNYERLSLSMDTSGNATLATEAGGTGTSGDLEIDTGTGDLTLTAAKVVTPNGTRQASVDLNSGTALTVGQKYFDDFAADRTLTFSGTPEEGDKITLRLIVSGATRTITVPSSLRVGFTSAATSLDFDVGYHTAVWEYVDSAWWLTDTGD